MSAQTQGIWNSMSHELGCLFGSGLPKDRRVRKTKWRQNRHPSPLKLKELVTSEEVAILEKGLAGNWGKLYRIEMGLPPAVIRDRGVLILGAMSILGQIISLLARMGFSDHVATFAWLVLTICAIGIYIFCRIKANYEEGTPWKAFRILSFIITRRIRLVWCVLRGQKPRTYFEECLAAGIASEKEFVLCPGPGFRLRRGSYEQAPMTRPHILANLLHKARWPSVKGELHIKFPWSRPVEVFFGEAYLPGGTGRIPPPVAG